MTTKMAHFEPKIKKKFWEGHSTLPRPILGGRGTQGHPSPHSTLYGVSSASNLAPSALAPLPSYDPKYVRHCFGVIWL